MLAAISSSLSQRNTSPLILHLKCGAFSENVPLRSKHLNLDNPAGLIWSAATAERDFTMAIMTRRQQQHRQQSAANYKYVLAADYRG